MPKDFEMCIAAGGKVITKDLGNGKYMHICMKGGKSHAGEVKMKKMQKETMGNKYSKAMMNG